MAIWTIAKTTFSEAMRKKIINVCFIVAVAMIVIALSFSQYGAKQELTIVKSLGLFVILLAGFVISLILSVSLIPTEIERHTIYTILSKPVARYEFILGKYLGGLITLFVNIMLMGLVFILMLALKVWFGDGIVDKHGADMVSIIKPHAFDPKLVLGIVLIYFQFFMMSAVVMLFSVFLPTTVNYFASAAVYAIGSGASAWQSIAFGHNEKTSAIVSCFYKAIYYLFPNFDKFNIQNTLIHPQLEVKNMGVYVFGTIIYAICYSMVTMLVAVLFFDKKEV